MFTAMGLADEDAVQVVAAFDRSDEAMLNAVKTLEFGIVESERRSPYTAMTVSGCCFSEPHRVSRRLRCAPPGEARLRCRQTLRGAWAAQGETGLEDVTSPQVGSGSEPTNR